MTRCRKAELTHTCCLPVVVSETYQEAQILNSMLETHILNGKKDIKQNDGPPHDVPRF